ncbi:MAG: zinc ribbon domain-containing protein [Coriobacteriia bacterium]|nr:zinc ribbon domain-containing protein [Coriobacteriia bacterium]
MFCTQCGNQLVEGAVFCIQCGASVNNEVSGAAATKAKKVKSSVEKVGAEAVATAAAVTTTAAAATTAAKTEVVEVAQAATEAASETTAKAKKAVEKAAKATTKKAAQAADAAAETIAQAEEKVEEKVEEAAKKAVAPVSIFAEATAPQPVAGTAPLSDTKPVAASTAPLVGAAGEVGDATAENTAVFQTPTLSAAEQVVAQTAVQAPQKKKRSKKGLIISLIVLLLLAALGTAAVLVVPGLLQAQNYEKAQATMDAGDYKEAHALFSNLGDYEDAEKLAVECQRHIDYQKADDAFEVGMYEEAREIFAELGADGFLDAKDRVNDCDYKIAEGLFADGNYTEARDLFWSLSVVDYKDAAEQVKACEYKLAEKLLADGDREGAYYAFIELDDYSDAKAKAESCLVDTPKEGVLFQNTKFKSSDVSLKLDANKTPWPVYLKIYSGDTHVATVFLNKGGKATINLPAGTYTFREAYGEAWFGEELMFGEKGTYSTMLFDGGKDTAKLEKNYTYTLTLYQSDAGNVGSEAVDRDNF